MGAGSMKALGRHLEKKPPPHLRDAAGVTNTLGAVSRSRDLSLRGSEHSRRRQQTPTAFGIDDEYQVDDYDLASRSGAGSRRESSRGSSASPDLPGPEIEEFVSFRAPSVRACRVCGTSVPQQARYCSDCGSPIPAENEIRSPRVVTGSGNSGRPVYCRKVKVSYNERSVLGMGAKGVVYRAIDIDSGQPLAVKVMYTNMDDEAEVKAVRGELRHLSTLQHPNIVEYMGCLLEGGRVSILMERLECGSLEEMLKQFPSGIPEKAIRSFTLQLVKAIAYVHDCGVTHRDIKPANILLASDGTIKLADFGSACLAGAPGGKTDGVKLAGTPAYMPPETVETVGNRNRDAFVYGKAHDVWSIGCCVHQLLSGEIPWGGFGVKHGFALLAQIRKKFFPVSEALSPMAKDFLSMCFRQDPLKRASAVQLLIHPFLEDDDKEEGGEVDSDEENVYSWIRLLSRRM
ncbi:hypothetical protein DQ04_00741180 [Trypanosoma grayi]|uniref:hypothetical protein n=1 Tax=Trypanosoma grayi TaxID=71804 RepID=UPI0004F412A1|nr:hypothetical protein DQ04_00741180 [Trypanosoma grayi]KEG13874.1 hypothetical protein DQ04_00741180 [Trypanosoma grayi]